MKISKSHLYSQPSLADRIALLIFIWKGATEDPEGQNLWCDTVYIFTFDKQGHTGYSDNLSSKSFYNLLVFLAH